MAASFVFTSTKDEGILVVFWLGFNEFSIFICNSGGQILYIVDDRKYITQQNKFVNERKQNTGKK